MRYVSTGGGTDPVEFQEAVMMGLARDGGLLLPETIPDVSAELSSWRSLSYQDLACRIMGLYADLPPDELRQLVDRSYEVFDSPDVTPVVPVGDVHILELFHGPTLAFKDLALQFLGNLFEHILAGSGKALTILAATSGDTGSAAIYGIRSRAGMRIFVMHPHGRISESQERQMTSVLDDNVVNLAIDGTFDDCQRIMKTIFSDLAFKDAYSLGSVNSINWARVLAQIVYYFYAAFRVMEQTGAGRVRFSVPTGNFGDILAGYLAARMGLPVGKLVLATNENDILARFFRQGIYSKGEVQATVSPSMDIQVASNFERYLYYRVGENPETLKGLMGQFASEQQLSLQVPTGEEVDSLFAAGTGDTASTLATIRDFHEQHDYLLDPHTAVGVHVASNHLHKEEPMICLATAHPAKFGDAIKAATGKDLAHHPTLDVLKDLPTRCKTLPASVDEVKACIESGVSAGAA